MYKIIAIDLDGTSLNGFGQMTINTREHIKEASRRGVETIIASGRNINAIKAIAEEIGTINYIIAGNGAIIYDFIKNEILYENYIPKKKALEIIDICEKNSIYYSVYTNRTIITNCLKYNVLYYNKENEKKEDIKKTHITLTENVYDYVKNMNEEVLKIFICDKEKTIFRSILKKFEQVKNIDILDVSHMCRKMIKQGTLDVPIEYYYTEISSTEVDKWNALEILLKKFKINKQDVIAIGDNMNDKKMIKEAGLGVAMGNSEPSVKELADYITDSNEQEGVAKTIDKFIINNN